MLTSIKDIIEIIMGLIMALTISGLLFRAIVKQKGIGARIIQFTCIAFTLPTIIILSLEKVLTGETVATLLGGLVGYVLSGISNYDKKSAEE